MDLPTLVFANFVLMAFATLALALLARLYPHAAGMRAFLLATASLAAGAALVGVADPVRQGAALALANGLLVLGLACLNWAMAAYWRWPEPRIAAHLAAIGAMVLLYGAFTGGANNLGARAVIVGTAMGVELALGAIQSPPATTAADTCAPTTGHGFARSGNTRQEYHVGRQTKA
ncbi:MAG TPA: hypothetical protein VMV93_13765 [Chloroflexota bacterium]|nr:hypothetical protein [Chloroflexota bacterium]